LGQNTKVEDTVSFDALYDSPMPYIAGWHQAPAREGRDLARLDLADGQEAGQEGFGDALPTAKVVLLQLGDHPVDVGERLALTKPSQPPVNGPLHLPSNLVISFI